MVRVESGSVRISGEYIGHHNIQMSDIFLKGRKSGYFFKNMVNSYKEEKLLNWKWTAFSSINPFSSEMRIIRRTWKSFNFPAQKIAVRFWLVKPERFISLMTVLKSHGKSEKGVFCILLKLMIFINNFRRNFCVNELVCPRVIVYTNGFQIAGHKPFFSPYINVMGSD